ncbi:MAG: hypothetical protein ACRDRH_25660 [Pseudonocardia sp.]
MNAASGRAVLTWFPARRSWGGRAHAAVDRRRTGIPAVFATLAGICLVAR